MRRVPLLLAAILLTGPAAAQTLPGFAGDAPRLPRTDSRAAVPGPYRDAADIRQRADDGRRSGQLSRREARRTKREAGQLGDLADRYGADGYSDAEQRELEIRGHVMRDAVNAARSRPKR